MFTVRSTDPAYTSPIIGNGQVVTTVGPTGYHNGLCPGEETANRTLFWAGRRLDGATHPLIRFGRLARSLTVDGVQTTGDDWEQTLDYDHGVVVSTLDHGAIREQTRSLVCLTANVLVFHTILENRGDRPVHMDFVLEYEFGDAEGRRTGDTRLEVSCGGPQASLGVRYEVNDQLGEVRIGYRPGGEVVETEVGARFPRPLDLEPGDRAELWFWVVLSDRLKYTHYPDFDRVTQLLRAHERAWDVYWDASRLEFGNQELELLRQTCLYAIRCSSSSWSIPPAYLSTHWEGRTFHDELYPFLALLASNHVDLAARIPNFRLGTLPVALQRSAGRGAHFPWESLENGREGGPYGHWMDERFHVAQFSETAWRYYLCTRDLDDLRRFYPLLKACAEWFIHDVLIRDEAEQAGPSGSEGRLKVRPISDFDEQVYPVENGIYTACAAARSLENAARAAELLGLADSRRAMWRASASEVRQTLPVNEDGRRYSVSDDADYAFIGQAGMVFPFSFDVHGERSRETVTHIRDACRTRLNWSPGSSPSYQVTHWMWTTGHLAAMLLYQGRADEGYAVLRRAPASAGPFLAPNEHFRDEGGARLSWFTTGAGMVVYAIHAMFVQVEEAPAAGVGPIVLPAVPSAIQDATFERLMCTHGVRISGRIEDGRLAELTASSGRAMAWSFRMPHTLASAVGFEDGVAVSSPDALGLVTVTCMLGKGRTRLV